MAQRKTSHTALGRLRTHAHKAAEAVRNLSDKKVEGWIGQLLRGGVVLSASIGLVGLTIFLLHHADATPALQVFHVAHPVWGWRGLLDLEGTRSHMIMQISILTLIATPVARVLFLVGAFAAERDWMYVGVSGFVFCVLIFSLFYFR
jgi:uncharacterized membrane protein